MISLNACLYVEIRNNISFLVSNVCTKYGVTFIIVSNNLEKSFFFFSTKKVTLVRLHCLHVPAWCPSLLPGAVSCCTFSVHCQGQVGVCSHSCLWPVQIIIRSMQWIQLCILAQSTCHGASFCPCVATWDLSRGSTDTPPECQPLFKWHCKSQRMLFKLAHG